MTANAEPPTAAQTPTAAQPLTAEQLFTAERSNLMAVAYRLLGTMSDAEDVLQDVCGQTAARWKTPPPT